MSAETDSIHRLKYFSYLKTSIYQCDDCDPEVIRKYPEVIRIKTPIAPKKVPVGCATGTRLEHVWTEITCVPEVNLGDPDVIRTKSPIAPEKVPVGFAARSREEHTWSIIQWSKGEPEVIRIKIQMALKKVDVDNLN